jgi:alpha-galactosidase
MRGPDAPIRLRIPSSTLRLALAAAIVFWPSAAFAASGPTIAAFGDAFITHPSGSDLWYLGTTNLELTIGFNASRTLAPQRLLNPVTGRTWDIAPEADVSITVGGERLTLGGSGALTFTAANARATAAGVQLDFVFDHRTLRARITRSYAVYPGSPTVETWTRVENTGSSPMEASDLMGWQFTMPTATVRWLGGLRGDTADNVEAGAFALDEWDLEAGDRLEIGSERRSTEEFIPFFLVDDGRDVFYGGIMWSAGWRLAFERRSDTLHVASIFPGVGTAVTPSQPVEVPHTFFGVTARSLADESGALRRFIINGIRGGRPFQPLVTYNTWFPYGVRINEDAMVAEMDRAGALGVELFVVDAGWWVGAGENGDYDYDSGLGSWAEDRERFPASLASLSDYAHGMGMKFGLWVEPARVALSTVNQPGLAREAWLSTLHREYGATGSAQICLASEAARQWVLGRLIDLIVRVNPDYLKWDNNFWINCDREGHGHGTTDGPFAHTRGLYSLLGELRQRFPNLLIENVSGGGNTLDFGMLAYTDVAWMDDRSAPSTHVRHNLEGLSFAFPPAYLLSFLIDGEGEPIASGYDLPAFVRSRMPGALGMTFRSERVDDQTAGVLAEQIQQYKRIRDVVADANGTLLSPQAPVGDTGWDVLQEVAGDGASALLFAFKASEEDGRLLVRLRGLRGDATYDVESLDAGPIGAVRGDALMHDGVEIVHSGSSTAHVLILIAR